MKASICTLTLCLTLTAATPVAPRITTKTESVTLSLIVFGDSYSDSGFRQNSPFPSLSEPLGYPPIGKSIDANYLDNPLIANKTTANGPIWPEYLTLRYNTTPTVLYDFAISGASIPDGFTDEILLDYEPRFSSLFRNQSGVGEITPQGGMTWGSNSSIFVSWILINDINWCSILFNNYPGKTFQNCLPQRMDWYFTLMDNLYITGARNFLFVNLPPLERTPLVFQTNQSAVQNYAQGVAYVNDHLLPTYVANFTATHPGVRTTIYDAHALFNEMLDNPHAYGFRNSQCYSCIGCYNVTGCFWSNNIHPVTEVHLRIADDMLPSLTQLGWPAAPPSS